LVTSRTRKGRKGCSSRKRRRDQGGCHGNSGLRNIEEPWGDLGVGGCFSGLGMKNKG